MANERVEGGFFRLVELPASQAAAAPDAFDRLRAGTLQGVLLNDAVAPDEAAALADRLARHDPPFLQTFFPGPFRSWFYGRCLDLTHPDLDSYFDEAETFRADLAALSDPPLPDRVAPLLSALDHGRPFRAPPGPRAGQRYMFSTLRGHDPGGFVPPHCEDEQLGRAPYHHLRELVEPHVLSFVLALTTAEGGGALEIYDLRFAEITPDQMQDGRTAVDHLASERRSVGFRLAPGQLMIFDGGRHVHRLSPLEGDRVRWTVSSFMARARDGSCTYCWG